MDSDKTNYYRPKIAVAGGGLVVLLIVFFGLTLPQILSSESSTSGQVLGLASFWLFGILLMVVPFGFRLEVGRNYIKTYFLGICVKEVKSSEVRSVEYGKIFAGGLYGKGLRIKQNNKGLNGYSTLGENFYGKEAVTDAKKALES